MHHADLYPKKSVIVLDELQICPCRIMPSGTWQQSQCEFAVLSTRQQKRINLPMTDNDIQKTKKGIITIPYHCGENRIRTCEPVLPVTRFPGVPLQPLEHLSSKTKHFFGCEEEGV